MAIAKGTKRVAENRKARHEYFIEDTYECGIALAGTEVKSIRAGKVNLKDSYAQVKNGECYLIGMHVSPYEQGNIFNRDPFRERKLLLHNGRLNLAAFVQGGFQPHTIAALLQGWQGKTGACGRQGQKAL